MKTILLSFLTFLLILSTQPITRLASAEQESQVSERIVEARQLDKNAEILARYLSKYNSPLQYHAQDFIDAANTYNLDWKLVAAISGVESTFGKRIPGGYNGWGWGVYGTQAIYFNSWTEAIYTVSKGLRENYVNKGYTEPYSMNKIYAASPAWGKNVTFFMQDLEKFAAQIESETIDITKISSEPKIAAISGQPVIR